VVGNIYHFRPDSCYITETMQVSLLPTGDIG